jgi:hypothetical protein
MLEIGRRLTSAPEPASYTMTFFESVGRTKTLPSWTTIGLYSHGLKLPPPPRCMPPQRPMLAFIMALSSRGYRLSQEIVPE